MKNHLL